MPQGLQLSPPQIQEIVSQLRLEYESDPNGAFLEVLQLIASYYPKFAMRDFSKVWAEVRPGLLWSKTTEKIFYALTEKAPEKGLWVLRNSQIVQPATLAPQIQDPEFAALKSQLTKLVAGMSKSSDLEEILKTLDQVGELQKRKASPENLASQENLSKTWMAEAINQGLNKRIAANIRYKFPKESWEDLLSEVSTLLVEWGEKGLCDAYIKKGKPPTVAILSVWAAQKIRQRVYKCATDAHLRQTQNLRTQTEVRKRKEKGVGDYILEDGLKADPSAPKTVWVIQGEQAPEPVTISPEACEEIHEEQPEKIALIEGFLRAKRSENPDKTARLFEYLRAGVSAQEASLIEGESELSIAASYKGVREDLKEAPMILRVALGLLKKIAEEPFSSKKEIQEEQPGIENLDQALNALLEGDLVGEKGGTYFTTNSGRILCESVA